MVAPFGASAVLLFGHSGSPLAQPRNLVAGNTLGALVSVSCVALLGDAPWVMGLAVGLTIALGQRLRCLHPPAGAVALLGVLLVLVVLFSWLRGDAELYPHHWL